MELAAPAQKLILGFIKLGQAFIEGGGHWCFLLFGALKIHALCNGSTG
jgi:hypothetical protein